MSRFGGGLIAMVLAAAVSAAVPDARDFARRADFQDVQISPDGQRLATLVPDHDQVDLAVVDVATLKVLTRFNAGKDRSIANYAWVGSDRLITELALKYGIDDQPRLTGELMAIDADGKHEAYLFGYRDQDAGYSTHLGALNGVFGAYLISTIPSNPQKALIGVYERRGRGIARSFWIDTHTGRFDHELRGPMDFQWGASVLADRQGEIRYASGYDEKYVFRTFTRSPESPTWQEKTARQAASGIAILPLHLSADNQQLFRFSNAEGRKCLEEETLASGAVRVLACDPVADIDHLIASFDGSEPVAAVYEDGKTTIKLIESANPDVKTLKDLMAAFPDAIVEPVSASQDGQSVVLEIYSDRDPGAYYLFDSKTRKVKPLFAAYEDLDPADMAERRPVEYQDRDGITIHGYLTIPPGKPLKKLPLVVLPHGGPFGIVDTQRWDEDAEFLATHGYLVLQPNFRGSGGYGRAFLEAGKRSWGGVMIDDITDGARWAVAQGYADADRLCIYGASYGGYAALMSAVREPDLYKCAVGYAGVYDLTTELAKSDTAETDTGKAYLKQFVGADAETLKAQSPITYIDRLKAAVMIIHGRQDSRVPFTQALELRSALDGRHYPYEWLEKAGEGHGFFEENNREEVFTRVLAFLDKNIGPGASMADAAATARSPQTP